ncbi:hypothetical protein N7504_009009 [Penicillium tannophilum]|nr:hypothetical protein N7504_009009 [Penicillium tannophilum]
MQLRVDSRCDEVFNYPSRVERMRITGLEHFGDQMRRLQVAQVQFKFLQGLIIALPGIWEIWMVIMSNL